MAICIPQVFHASVVPLAALLLSAVSAAVTAAAPSSDTLAARDRPRATCRSPGRSEFQERWDKTQFGQMLADEVMQPFVDDCQEAAPRQVSRR